MRTAMRLGLVVVLAMGCSGETGPIDSSGLDAATAHDAASTDTPFDNTHAPPPGDANVMGDDTGSGTDAAALGTDGGAGIDAASPGTDAAASGTDAASPVPDAAVPATDAAIPATDAAMSDAGTTRTLPVGHCGAQRGLYFPASSWMYTDIHASPLRGNSANTTAWLTSHGGWGTGATQLQIDFGMRVNDATASTPQVPLTQDTGYYTPDCDDVSTFPLPSGYAIEGGATGACSGDCHFLVVDFAMHRLFESYITSVVAGSVHSTCVIAWNTTHDSWGLPPAAGVVPDPSVRNWGDGQGCTSTDAAGFPVAPMLVTVGDVMSGRVEHAIRFILPNARMQRAATATDPHPVWVWPATHAGGPTAADPNAPIYGSRWRLHDPFDYAAHGLDGSDPVIAAIVYGLQHYGMVLADGGNVPLTFEDDAGCGTTWASLGLDSHSLYGITPADFDVIETGGTGSGYDCMPNPAR